MAVVGNRKRRAADVGFNMTPMIDVVFLLIIFFMLVGTFISAENLTVELPAPDRSLAAQIELPDRVVLNCQYVAAAPGGVQYRLGPIVLADMTELQARLTALAQDRPDIQVILRADRRIKYEMIRGCMQAIAEAGIQNMNIAAEVED